MENSLYTKLYESLTNSEVNILEFKIKHASKIQTFSGKCSGKDINVFEFLYVNNLVVLSVTSESIAIVLFISVTGVLVGRITLFVAVFFTVTDLLIFLSKNKHKKLKY